MEKDLKELVDKYIETNSVKLVQKAAPAPKQPKAPKKAAEKPARARANAAFERVVAAAKRLLQVVLKNEGLANKDLAKFETQIQNLADKWDR